MPLPLPNSGDNEQVLLYKIAAMLSASADAGNSPQVLLQKIANALTGIGVESGSGSNYNPSAVAITGGTIAGVRFRRRVQSVAYAATVTPNADTTDLLKIAALTGNLTLATPTGTPTDGQTMQVELLQDATGGRTLTLGAGFLFPSSSSLSSPIAESHFTTASALSVLALQYSATRSKWLIVSFVPGY